MNQANYAELAEDTRGFGAEAGVFAAGSGDGGQIDAIARAPLRHVSVEYNQETKLGETIQMHIWVIEGEVTPAFGIEGRREGLTKPLFRARIDADPSR